MTCFISKRSGLVEKCNQLRHAHPSVGWLVNLICPCSHLAHYLLNSYGFLIHYQKWRFLCSSSGHIGPPPQKSWLLSLEWLAYSEHVIWYILSMCPPWYQFIDPHLITYHLSIGVQIIVVLEIGQFTLIFPIHVDGHFKIQY
jgi:hypothetical protein